MKIAFLTPGFPKTSETFIINQVVELIEKGHDVTVFSEQRPENEVVHPITEEYDLRDITVYSEGATEVGEGVKLTARTLPRLLSKHARELSNLDTDLLLRKEAPNVLKNFLTFLDHGESFDVCHAHFGHVGQKWAFLSDLPDQGPFVTTFYGFDTNSLVHPNDYDRYSGFWRKCDHCIGISQHIRSRMILLGCPEGISSKIPIGVDTERFEPNHGQPDTDRMELVSVARYTEKKGLKYAIEAVGRTVDSGVEVRYRIAGDGPLREDLEEQIRELGLESNVELLGWQTQEEVRELLRDGDVFLLPSVTSSAGDMEGQALVFQEAQAMGLPVIGTYHDGIPEGVLERESGRLVPERDVDGLVDAISFFAGNPSAIEQYGKAGRRFVEENYDNAGVVSEQVRLYEKLGAGE